ncbi:hypothetical protein JK359_35905 [Streptomyces actinomycinicus]|uniref:Uncharacterized protein n=1 Tax=Streptomyces actinomycinicus TaxID=1695166 RepID=A0A937JTY7_9ACTN|nr:hypothetical protein [Streptomyces actinomycinicus]MBL1087283.1 hypothetical protein [Streptomyces actinomycinicus]
MAKRKVHRRARKILDEEPSALVWCGLHKDIPQPPKEVHRAAGKGRLKPGRHWLYYMGLVLAAVIIIPWFLVDKLDELLTSKRARQDLIGRRADREPTTQRADGDRHRPLEPSDDVFDGDWSLTAGQVLLRWYGQSPNPRRLLLLTRDRICLAASPGRRLSPTKADDFDIVTEFTHGEARIHREPGQRHFFLRFTDGSWLNLGRLADSEDADHFLKTVSS